MEIRIFNPLTVEDVDGIPDYIRTYRQFLLHYVRVQANLELICKDVAVQAGIGETLSTIVAELYRSYLEMAMLYMDEDRAVATIDNVFDLFTRTITSEKIIGKASPAFLDWCQGNERHFSDVQYEDFASLLMDMSRDAKNAKVDHKLLIQEVDGWSWFKRFITDYQFRKLVEKAKYEQPL